ncbi:MAG: PDZ domain-containing protein [Ruminococcaceae bacterium]|nr:PDZ domain-containing protein [Oscillospiraceae bacterium]
MIFTKKRLLSLTLALFLMGSGLVPVFAQEQAAESASAETVEQDKSEHHADLLDAAISLVMQRYKFDISKEELYRNAVREMLINHPELFDDAMSGVFNNLDQHSAYYTAEEYAAFTESLTGEICGIGVSIMDFSEGLQITTVYPNTPAEEAGLMPGDIIISANGTDIRGLDLNVAKSHIVGEEGTWVKIGYLRNGTYAEVDIQRRFFTVESGYYQAINNDTIGYIALYSFELHSDEFVREALSEFDRKGITDIILDLRYNPGGMLEMYNNIANMFIPEGPIIHIEFRNPIRNTTFYSENKDPKYNLVVLANEFTASAAEAFSGAVQDTGIGIVVGNRTYGKGTVQQLREIVTGAGLRLTEAVYLTPARRNINEEGISPNVKVFPEVIPFEQAGYGVPTYERVMREGDTGEDVFMMEKRLNALGYDVGIPDEIYDNKTFFAVKRFQQAVSLYPYGVLDINTQLAVQSALNGKEIVLDRPLERAIKLIETDMVDNYKPLPTEEETKTE